MLRSMRLLLPLVLLAAAVIGPAPSAGAQDADTRFFSQTSYRIDNDAFWTFFQRRGGVRTFGYPVSRQFKLQGFPVQIFQRVVMQLQPDGSVGTLNLLDPGLMPYTTINGSTFPAPDPTIVGGTPPVSDPAYADKIIQFTDANAPDTFEGAPVNFGQTFHTTVTFEDAFPDGNGPQSLVPLLNLQIWGAPTSKPTYDPTNRNFIYQRFQRGIMHYDKGCGCTQGLLLADYLKALMTGQNLPPDLAGQAKGSPFLNQYAPNQPLGMARPNDLPGSDLTSAFDKQQPSAGGATTPATTPPGPATNFGYGFQVHMWDFNPDATTQLLGLVKLAGFNWIKQQVEWSSLETSQGQYNWRPLDAVVNSANSQGLKIMLSVAHAPTFYQSPSSGLMPSDPSTFQRLMQAMAARYQGKVQMYELWNEENLAREAGNGNVDPSHYLPILKAGYQGTKAGDPTATALLGAPSPTGANIPGQVMDDVQYLTALYGINGGEAKGYFDALSAHPSGFSNPPDCTPATPQCSLSGGFNNDPSFFAFYRVGQYHDAMVAAGDGNKQIWFTEFGYASAIGGPVVPGYEYAQYISEDQQARFLVQSYQMAKATGYVAGMMTWNLNFQTVVGPTDEKFAFGVVRKDWSPRPAYSALAGMPK